MKTQGITFIVWLIVVALGLVGWVINIIKLIGADAFNGMVIARAIGVFIAPLGAVLGFL